MKQRTSFGNVKSIVRPLAPTGSGWVGGRDISTLIGSVYETIAWTHAESNMRVLSAVEVATEPGIEKGPEYHISISKELRSGEVGRCTSQEAQWVLAQFGCEGAEEDNHINCGSVRNFWRPVAENLVGIECKCKDDEPVIKEGKGDFIYRPPS